MGTPKGNLSQCYTVSRNRYLCLLGLKVRVETVYGRHIETRLCEKHEFEGVDILPLYVHMINTLTILSYTKYSLLLSVRFTNNLLTYIGHYDRVKSGHEGNWRDLDWLQVEFGYRRSQCRLSDNNGKCEPRSIVRVSLKDYNPLQLDWRRPWTYNFDPRGVGPKVMYF